MNPDKNIRYEFEARPVAWCFPGGDGWITGWLENGADELWADIRAWMGGQIFLGVLGLPFDHAAMEVGGRQRFALLVGVDQSYRNLRLELWSARTGWVSFFQTAITVAPLTNAPCSPVDWLAQLPRFLGKLGYARSLSLSGWADEAVRSAAAKPLNILPVPPFLGSLETPTEDGYVREGRVLVSGWLAHEAQEIGQLTAQVSGGPEVGVAYGLQRRDVGEQFPHLLGGAHSHFVGLVELPSCLPAPVLLMVFAETRDGKRSLVFARRFLPWNRDQVGRVENGAESRDGVGWLAQQDRRSDEYTRSPIERVAAWRRWCLAWTLVGAARRFGVAWWEIKRLAAVAFAPSAVGRATQRAVDGAFAESTPLSLFLSSLEDHEIRTEPIPAGGGGAQSDGLNLLFVLHGDFSCASALHVLALTRELTPLGHECIVAVPERLDTLDEHIAPACRGILHADALLGVWFGNGRGPDIVHGWTTREGVRLVTERVKQLHSDAVLVIHLEDNEHRILAETLQCPISELLALPPAELDRRVTPDLSHPRRSESFLQSARGATVVIDRLASFVPLGIPVQVLTPAADRRYFYPRRRLADFHRLIDSRNDATILFYHGNVHPSNAAEVRELYVAVLQLNRAGVPVRLIRTGRDPVGFLGSLAVEVAPYVSALGTIKQHRHLAELMALADIFVQPGWDNEFNAYRFPSKLPEFFSGGRPVILPRTNLGLVVRHGIDAYVLERADAAAIAGAVQTLRADPELAETLARGATAFAQEHFSWAKTTSALAAFYASILTETSTAPR